MFSRCKELILLCICFINLQNVSAYKALIFVQAMSNSQILFNYRVAEVLSADGLDVTILRIVLNPDATKGKLPAGVKEIVYKPWQNESLFREINHRMHSKIFVSDAMDMSLITEMTKAATDGCETQITDKKLMDQLRDEKFDVAFANMYDYCPFGIIHHLKIPSYIWMSSAFLLDNMAWYANIPNPTSYVPNFMSAKSDQMNFQERFVNTLALPFTLFVMDYMLITPETNIFRKHFGKDFPHLAELAGKSSLIYCNTEDLVDFPRPTMSKVINIGGLGMKEPAPLDEEWSKVMEQGEKGVVIFSMGTVADPREMSPEQKKNFVDAFKQFSQYQFIMKIDGGVFKEADGVKNIKVVPWTPQKDLMGHPRLKAFITHGGFNSLLEATFNGIPVIAMPLFGDQLSNLKRAERHGVAVGLDKTKCTKEQIVNALERVLHNPSYATNAKRLSRMLKMKPVKAEQLLTGWTKFAAEFKDIPNLQPAANHLNFAEYLLLDVYGAIAVILLIAFFVVRKVCQACLYSCCPNSSLYKKSKSD